MHQAEEVEMERETVCRAPLASDSSGFLQPVMQEECRPGSKINQQSIINSFNITAVVLSCLKFIPLNVVFPHFSSSSEEANCLIVRHNCQLSSFFCFNFCFNF